MNISDRVKDLRLPAGSYAVFGSGPMAARGMREAHDIDIIVTRDLFRTISADPSWNLNELLDHHSSLSKDGIEVYHTWAPGSWDVDELIKDADTIENVPYVELRSVLEWKKLRNKPKDQHDIETIEKYLAKNQ